MKKFFTSEKWKKISKKSSERELKKRKSSYKEKRKEKILIKWFEKEKRTPINKHTFLDLPAPKNFSFIDKIQKELTLHGRAWNEEELKMNFISFVLFLANVNVPEKIQIFYERRLSGVVSDIPISLVVDSMIASPTKAERPKKPYFFLQALNW